MRGASIALGACGGVALGVLGVIGPGGFDSKLYWRAPSPGIQSATPETFGPASAIEEQGAAVAAERGEADALDDDLVVDEESTGVELDADDVSPAEPPETGAVDVDAPSTVVDDATTPDTFPPLSPDLQESFRQAWFQGERDREAVRQFDLNAAEAAGTGEAETGAPEEASPEAEETETAAVDAEYAEEAPGEAATPEPVIPPPPYQVVSGYPLELQQMNREGTDPNFDPFYQDAVRLRQAFVNREEGGGLWSGIPGSAAWSGAATTGGATTGGATTDGAWTGAADVGMGTP